jgi:hypothetical protein
MSRSRQRWAGVGEYTQPTWPFMTPLSWGWAMFVWGYALLWFLVNDRVKLLAYGSSTRNARCSLPRWS